jgi:7-carboxy-7-deazaguanine synthase
MPGGKKVWSEVLFRANEIKVPIGKQQDYDQFKKWLDSYSDIEKPIWLQPLSQNKTATKLCYDLSISYGHRVSVQVHKFLGIR